ncbi:FAD-dependent oxidoreductase [Phaeobacter gallaeciensis]|uniref:FAD-dependent oxidoreductase n=1 Tax=Phaeobacter gallaeciensis TaxID=60890 RepID=UPI00237F5C6E|nr:FAD-dependent oxidoreductase [Phaeobacter gallaeciensis]MDE4098346.1 FAD-dependent oxidoreductase [Phaeobacter gallaeciensis]MDE4107156.1 FAD-dependent oxidoreductase [Phaeobacter gallaeciensis]MDE4111385.1 FAD-dependent oxidoreductase [Phaeobacter gallaeciensis]MDE4116081.1 FAD-dependent oxidoreductase [Phaeobacter gallaeciensis]MDE4120326.1 FAD-dependent oxidoreductase [Phaeobacter gallaeciensis]
MASPDVAEPPASFDLTVETLIVGAGAAGMVAALAAYEAGQEVLLVEADAVPSGSTALSAGLIPAAGTQFQAEAGIQDSAERFAQDIQAKAHHENDPDLVASMASTAAPVIEWLARDHGLPFSLVTDFDYPGHSRRRMHGLPTRSGQELIDALRARIETLDVPLICNRRAIRLYSKENRIFGAQLQLPDDSTETIGCARLILACNGFGGNRTMVSTHMAEIDNAVWFGHDGNRGEAVTWGQALGAATAHLGAYQGHGNVAHPHGILITWATITEGGVQVNCQGKRFWNEAQGYSEAARAVLAQPGGTAWVVFDSRIAAVARQFEDFKNAEKQGAVLAGESIAELAKAAGLPADALANTLGDIPNEGTDAFGRLWSGQTLPLRPTYHAVKVTGALFHTQGGLEVDPATTRVRRAAGGSFDNLHAVGGAACGVSGTGDSGYLSGNGLLAAVTLGYLAGRA